MNSTLKFLLTFLCCFGFGGAGVIAQDYDDMYFNSKDRKVLENKTQEQERKRKEQMAQYSSDENYSANHVDPKIIERYKQEAKLADSLGLTEFNPEFDSTYYQKLLETADFSMSEDSYQETQAYSQPSVYPAQQNNSTFNRSVWGEPMVSLSFGFGFGGRGNYFNAYNNPFRYNPFTDPFSPYYDPFYDPYDPFYAYRNPFYREVAWRYGRFGNRYNNYCPYPGQWGNSGYVAEGNRREYVRGQRVPNRSRVVRNRSVNTPREARATDARSRTYRSTANRNARVSSTSRTARRRPTSRVNTSTRSRSASRSVTDRPTRSSSNNYSSNRSSRKRNYSSPSKKDYQRNSSSRSNKKSYSRPSNSSKKSYSRSNSNSSSRSSSRSNYSRSSSRSSSTSSGSTRKTRSSRQ